MKTWRWLFAVVLAGLPIYLWQQQAPSSADTGPPREQVHHSAPVLPDRLVGAGSCAAAGCHNGNFLHGPAGSEYTRWNSQDRHAKAYEVLFDPQALRIQENLQSSRKAHEDRRCLSCHVHPHLDPETPPADAAYFRTDGVSCEACHGGAKDWLSVHHLHAWRFRTAAEKQKLGMCDTQNLLGRIKVCVSCHVGAPGMDVNHDLIAAGHPRLNFEFTAFHAQMPHHWPDAKDRDPYYHRRGRPDFEARAWVIGQLVTTQAALELLAHRANEKQSIWPEFAEHDCTACHHSLVSPSVRQQLGYGKRKPGALPWGNYITMTEHALSSLGGRDDAQLRRLIGEIQQSFDSGKPDRKAIAGKAKEAAALMKSRLEELGETKPDGRWVDRLEHSMKLDGAKATGSWDALTQFQLGLAALQQARRDMKMAVFPLDFPNNSQDASFEPGSIRARLNDFTILGGKQR